MTKIEELTKLVETQAKQIADLTKMVQHQTDVRATNSNTNAITPTNIEQAKEVSSLSSYDVLTKYKEDVCLNDSGKKTFFITFDARTQNMRIPTPEWRALNQHHGKKGIWIYRNAVYVMKDNKTILNKIAKCGVKIPVKQVA